MISRLRMVPVSNPSARWASMYDSSRIESTCERMVRVSPGQLSIPRMRPTTYGFSGRKKAARTTISASPGTVSMTSVIVIRMPSIRPPLYPANVPINVPRKIENSAPEMIIWKTGTLP